MRYSYFFSILSIFLHLSAIISDILAWVRWYFKHQQYPCFLLLCQCQWIIDQTWPKKRDWRLSSRSVPRGCALSSEDLHYVTSDRTTPFDIVLRPMTVSLESQDFLNLSLWLSPSLRRWVHSAGDLMLHSESLVMIPQVFIWAQITVSEKFSGIWRECGRLTGSIFP